MSKIDAIKSKTDEQNKARGVAEKDKRAHDLGFDDIDDYELWIALENLREATKSRRRKVSDRDNPAQKIRINVGTLAA